VSPASDRALAPLAWRVRARWLLEATRVGLLAGIAGAALITLAGRVLVRPEWPTLAISWGVVGLGAAVALALPRWPNRWAVARAADGLGLGERVASALHAERVGHPAAVLVERDAARALEHLDPSAYAVVAQWRGWRLLGALLLLLVGALVVPVPPLGDAAAHAADARATAAARTAVRELSAQVSRPPTPEPLAQATAAELRTLDERLARAADAAEAARALEDAQGHLAQLPDAEDYARSRARDQVASAWASQPGFSGLAQALRAGDTQAVRDGLANLGQGAATMTPEQRQQAQLGLQAGANAARDVPSMAGALREAATAANTTEDGQAVTGDALARAAELLAQSAARAADIQTTREAQARLGQTRAALGSASASVGTTAVDGGGTPKGSASGGVADRGNSPGSRQSGASGDGGSGPSAGASAAGANTGAGSGAGSGGVGGAGAGHGAGAGAGGGPAPGQPGTGAAGLTSASGSGAPASSGPTRYDPVYAPSLLGGEGGPQVQAPGDARGASGQTVDLPNSPKTLGATRPYDQVYGQYETAARESLARQELPQNLQGLVQRYFSAIAPDGGTSSGGR